MVDPKLGERILDPACGTGGGQEMNSVFPQISGFLRKLMNAVQF